MPRAGLNRAEVVRAGADLADELGFANLSMGTLAEKLGVRTPSLYKHVANLAQLQHGIAESAMTDIDARTRDAMHGLSGAEALRAFAHAFGDYVAAHPGRYSATVAIGFTGSEDELLKSSVRVFDSMAAVLRGYGIPDAQMDHAIRTLRCAFHGFATLQASGGFHWSGDPKDSYEWMIDFIDRGLRGT